MKMVKNCLRCDIELNKISIQRRKNPNQCFFCDKCFYETQKKRYNLKYLNRLEPKICLVHFCYKCKVSLKDSTRNRLYCNKCKRKITNETQRKNFHKWYSKASEEEKKHYWETRTWKYQRKYLIEDRKFINSLSKDQKEKIRNDLKMSIDINKLYDKVKQDLDKS